jgi:hypothetical protein
MIKPLSAFQYRLLGTAIAVLVMWQRGMTFGSFVCGHHAHRLEHRSRPACSVGVGLPEL